jgi:CAAX protease family protein
MGARLASPQVVGLARTDIVVPMTDSEPGGSVPGTSRPPARPPGPVPTGYVPREWLVQRQAQEQQATSVPPPPTAGLGAAATTPQGASPPLPPPPALGDVPFLDTPWVPPTTKRAGFMWLVLAVAGFLVGQLGAVVFGIVAGLLAGKSTSQLQTIASQAVPPEWYVVATLLGLWIGLLGAPWLASRTQGTRNFVRDLGVRFKLIDLVGIAVGIGGQILVVLLYAPFQRHIHNFNAPSQRLTGGSHGAGFVVIAVFTVLLAPAMEELFFRGLLLKALVRLFTPQRPGEVPSIVTPGRVRATGVVLAVVLDGLLFGLAHGELVQLAGLAGFGMVLAAISYRTGRLGMNIVAHATFNCVAIVAIAANGNALIH